MAPFVLVFQILVMTGYMFIHDPRSFASYFLSAFQAGSGFMIITVMQGYAVKRVPKMIRGIVMALIIAAASLGGVLYLQVSKLFYESNPNMVFGLIAIFDGVSLIAVLICIAFGKYGEPPSQIELEGENDSKANEVGDGGHYMDIEPDTGFAGDIPDAPFGDIYEEHIPEVGS